MRDHPILVEGATCWRIARADRFHLIVDAADYFRALKEAMLGARHSILLIGWDFDTRVVFEPGGASLEGPNRLGRFFEWLVRRNEQLHIHMLEWDVGALAKLARGTTPLFILNWLANRRIHFRLDKQHPLGAAHHQKIVVIDDAIAFCGGIDITAARWDTRAHRDEEPGRRLPRGGTYAPWHDAAVAVEGPVARCLGELARDRWRRATGEPLESPPGGRRIWPGSLRPDMSDVQVAIARTAPEFQNTPGTYEIEALYLAAIAAARRTIYIESQYLAARKIAEALARRLSEPEGPEVVIVNPRSADGWLEQVTMDNARSVLFRTLRDADLHDRFRLLHPVTRKGAAIYVHAKIMVVDDRLIQVGSSNVNNRSMGFDTECNLAVETTGDRPDSDGRRRSIAAMRDGLVAEHLGVETATVGAAVARHGTLVAAIDAHSGTGRRLCAFTPPEAGAHEKLLGENDLCNPERAHSVWRLLGGRKRFA